MLGPGEIQSRLVSLEQAAREAYGAHFRWAIADLGAYATRGERADLGEVTRAMDKLLGVLFAGDPQRLSAFVDTLTRDVSAGQR